MTSWKLGLGCLVLLGVGCGAEDLTGEITDQALVSEGEGPRSEALFYAIRADFRRCAAPACGGSFVRALNREETTCVDGSKAAECYVASIDLRKLNLSESEAQKLESERGRVVVRGAIRPSRSHEGLGTLQAEEAWRGVNDTAAGATLLTTSTGIICAVAPCPTHKGLVVNQGRVLKIDPNRTPIPGTPDERERLGRDFRGDGALLSGRLTETNVPPTGVDALFEVTQVYLRVSGER